MAEATNAATKEEESIIVKAAQALSKLKKKKPEDDDCPEMDMMAFAAMMTIVLAFFIMLSSFAGKPSQDKAKEAIESFKSALDNFGLNRMAMANSDSIANLTLVYKKLGLDLNESESMVTGKRIANTVDDAITLEYERQKHQLFFPTKIDFVQHGGLELTKESKAYLNSLIKTIKDRDCQVTVCSYTDEGFVPTEEHPSSWQSSAEQAVAVTRYLHDVGRISFKRLVAVGYGKYRPLLGSESEFNTEGNDRINIIVSNN
ncbi:MAG: OmpA family protein [Planctomycetes bacterium]|nr:OmpA family protein [Planctomycetota bacterium]